MNKEQAYICIGYSNGKTIIKIDGEYELLGFFPEGAKSNMIVVLKRREKAGGK